MRFSVAAPPPKGGGSSLPGGWPVNEGLETIACSPDVFVDMLEQRASGVSMMSSVLGSYP